MIMTTIGFIGAGKVGTNLGKYLTLNGSNVSGYYSKSKSSAVDAAEFTNSRTFESLAALAEASDWIFITTTDHDIASVWNQLSTLNLANKAICHCSGSLSSLVFTGIEATGATGYSIHPMHAFADRYDSYKTLSASSMSIEGEGAHKNALIELFESAGNTVLTLKTDKKPLYHTANVVAANFVLALIDKSAAYFAECGVDKDDALKALMPLIRNNIDNIAKAGTTGALTGPIERNDLGTVSAHLKAIPKEDTVLYKEISKELLSIAGSKHPQRCYADMHELLKEVEK